MNMDPTALHDEDDDEPLPQTPPSDIGVLQTEYARATTYQQNLLKSIYQIAGIAFPGFTALASILAQQKGKLPEVLYWLSPLGFALLYAIILVIFCMVSFSANYVRELEKRLSRAAKIDILHYDSALGRAFFSFRTGSVPVFFLWGFIFVVVAFLYFAIVAIGAIALASQRSTGYSIFYVSVNLIIATLLAYLFVYSQMLVRPLYNRWIRDPDTSQSTYDVFRYFDLIRYAIVPRPFDVILKSTGVLMPFVLTVFTFDIPITRELILRLAAVYLCIDIMAKQSTYIWNDILDWSRDRAHPYKQSRPLAQLPSRNLGISIFLARTLITFLAAALVGINFDVLWLTPLVAAIFIYQFIYDRFAKPSGWFKLIAVSLGYSLRAVAGWAVALTGLQDSTRDHIVLGCLVISWVVVYMFGCLATYYRAEAIYVQAFRMLTFAWRWHHYTHNGAQNPFGYSTNPPKLAGDDAMLDVERWFRQRGLLLSKIAYWFLFAIGAIAAVKFGGVDPGESWPRIVAVLGIASVVIGLEFRTLNRRTRNAWMISAAGVLFCVLVLGSYEIRWFTLVTIGATLIIAQSYNASFEDIAWISMRVQLRKFAYAAWHVLFDWRYIPNNRRAGNIAITRLLKYVQAGVAGYRDEAMALPSSIGIKVASSSEYWCVPGAEARTWYEALQRVFPGITVTLGEVSEDGDWRFASWTAAFTVRGPMLVAGQPVRVLFNLGGTALFEMSGYRAVNVTIVLESVNCEMNEHSAVTVHTHAGASPRGAAAAGVP
jgi:hypothetical protein